MLSEAVHLSGVVRDVGGKPLADVWINHATLDHPALKTNAKGHFDIETRAPAIVFRKDGFSGRYYRVDRNANLEITLERAHPLTACSSSAACMSLKGFASIFCLPKVRGIKTLAQNNDIDYGTQWFVLRTSTGKKGIQHAAGPMWGMGLLDEDVWSAVQYTETDYRDLEGFGVIDARGKSASGESWRVLGSFGESASYRMASEDEAKMLDRVLDGICLKPRQRF
jgi:hypothetical protein